MTSRKRPDLQAAIARLASLYEYGALSASTQPAVFIDTVTDDVEKLRVENDRLEALFQQHHGVHSDWVCEGTKLRAENARLREALEEIERLADSAASYDASRELGEIGNVARAALVKPQV